MVSLNTYFFIGSFTTDVERYTKITVSTDADDGANSSILLTETGMFNYWVYGQNSASNLDPANTIGEVERGVLQVDGTFSTTYNQPTDDDIVYYGG